LIGSLSDPKAPDNEPRLKTLAFYRLVTQRSFTEIEERIARFDIHAFAAWPEPEKAVVRSMSGILAASLCCWDSLRRDRTQRRILPRSARLYWEANPILARLAVAMVAPIAHHLVQTLETFIALDRSGVFALIAQSVKSADQGGYGTEPMAADLIVRIVERYLADYRSVFADRDRMADLMDCSDVFVRAGWPVAQALTFKLAEIWRQSRPFAIY
jgi:hypothetical protein